MKQSVTIRLESDTLTAAQDRAVRSRETLASYIETLVRQDLNLPQPEPSLEVIAPDDIREYEPVRIEGETEERYKFRKQFLDAILDAGGH